MEWWGRQRVTIGAAMASALLGAGFTLLLVRSQPPPLRVIQPTSVPTPSEVIVHVSGAVATPGVYRLSATARVLDGLEAAGGATGDADPQALNLAAHVRDGQHIVVPKWDQQPNASMAQADTRASASSSADTEKIDLNRADEAQLDSLPGIGPVTAGRILDYRERMGQFDRVEELQEARLVNRPTYEQIRDLVTVQ